jgi:hypothetical protein
MGNAHDRRVYQGEVLRLLAKQTNRTGAVYFLVGLGTALLMPGLSMIGITVNLPLGAAVLLVAFGCVAYAFWIWEKVARIHIAFRVITILLVAGLYGTLVGKQIWNQYEKDHPLLTITLPMRPPAPPPNALERHAANPVRKIPPPRYHFTFDESPGWTDQLKNAIGHDLNYFCIYLSDVGFEIPAKFPAFKLARFGAAEGKSPAQFMISPLWGPRDVDLVSITLEYKLAADTGLAREAVSEYLFSFYAGADNPKLGDWELRRQAMPILATYFNWSYAARNLGLYRPTPSTSLTSWTDALWEMRTAFGQVYTDRVLYYGLKYMNQVVWPANTSFDIYFFDWAVLEGEWKEGSQHINETAEILHKRGVNVWTYQPK